MNNNNNNRAEEESLNGRGVDPADDDAAYIAFSLSALRISRCVQSRLSVDSPPARLLIIIFPSRIAYIRRHDAPIIHCCCKLPRLPPARIISFTRCATFALAHKVKSMSQHLFSFACVMHIFIFFLRNTRERGGGSNDGVTDSICVRSAI